MNTCPECNRFLGDAGHASTCSKRGLPPVRVEDDVVPVPEALAVRLLELMSIIADSRRGSFGWFSGYCPQLECKSIDVLLQEMRKLMERHNESLTGGQPPEKGSHP